MLLSGRASHCDTYTGRPDSDCMATGVMNWQAASVITTCTVAPALMRWRQNSAALKQAAPPDRPSTMWRPANSPAAAFGVVFAFMARNVAKAARGPAFL